MADIYADVRRRAVADPEGSLASFRAAKDELFATHPQSPLGPEARASFAGLPYAPYDPDARFEAPLDTEVDRLQLSMPMSVGLAVTATRIGRLHPPVGDLDVF